MKVEVPEMESISTVGRGYYNYYHDRSRPETADGKEKTAWYVREIPTDEIGRNNVRSSRDYEGADICRKVAEKLEGIAASNRSKYGSASEAKDAIWAKYSSQGAYKKYSHNQRAAMAMAEINMTLYGTVRYSDARILGEIEGDFTKSTLGRGDDEDRQYNINMLGKQMGNVLGNNGVNPALLGNSRFGISVNGFSNALSVFLLDAKGNPDASEGLLELVAAALQTGRNASNLFHNMLVDANRQGLVPTDQLAKLRLFSEFKQITGEDIREYKQMDDGFVNKDGKKAVDVYKEHLEKSNKVPAEFKGVAFDYYKEVEANAMRYDIAEVPELTLTLEYQNGVVSLPGGAKGFDVSA